MYFIYTDSDGNDLGILMDECALDMEVGGSNDFELIIPIEMYSQFDENGYIYAEGTEYGGCLYNPVVDTEDRTVSFAGRTFRGMLEDRYVVTSGVDYDTVSGDIYEYTRGLMTSNFGWLFVGPQGTSETEYNGQVPRNETVLNILDYIYSDSDQKVKITANPTLDGLRVTVEPAPINDLSETVEYSEECGVYIRMKRITRRKKYYLALGKGELANRMVRRYRADSNKVLTTLDAFPQDVPVIKFDYPNAETEKELKKAVLDDYKKREKNSMEINLDSNALNASVDIGDIVGGAERYTQKNISAEITKKTIKHENGMTTIESKVGEN